MSAQESVRPGYKQTEVGVIPDDWEQVQFSNMFEFRNGVNAEKDAYGKGTKFINVLEIINKPHLRSYDIPGRVSLTRSDIASYAVRYGDLIFNRTSEKQEEVGLSSVYLDNDTVVFGGFVIRGRPLVGSIDPVYSGYALRAPAIRAQIIARGQGAIRANVGQADLRNVLAPLPSISEQRDIATALSAVDALIAALDALITKKRYMKQAAMQQLLTGKIRLPGFGGTWSVARLRDYLKHPATYGIVKAGSFQRTGIRMLRGGDIHDGKIIGDPPFVSFEKSNEFARTVLQDGDVVIALVGYPGETAKIPDWLVGANISRAVGLLRPASELNADFFVFYLNSPTGRREFLKPSAGSAQLVVNLKDLNNLPIPLPPAPEQIAIATVFSDMDAELEALEAKRDKTRDLKQGMMQELLTGRIRLV